MPSARPPEPTTCPPLPGAGDLPRDGCSPVPAQPVCWKHLGLIWLGGFAAALALYAATLAPDVLMMDSGEYQWSTRLFPHNPLPQGPGNLVRVHFNYLLAAKAFALLVPVGSWFLRINLFSAVAAAIAAGNVSALTFSLTRSAAATVLAFLALVLGQTFWTYAVIAEVLTLQAATLSGELLLLYFWATSGRFRWLLALWLLNGLAAGAHVQNGLATPIYLLTTLIALWQGRIQLRQVLACAGGWLAGFSPYLVFCAQKISESGGWQAALGSATTGAYGGQMWQLHPSMWRVWLKGVMFIVLNYPTGLALLVIPGLAALHRHAAGTAFKWGLVGAAGVNLLFAMTYRVPDQQSFFVPAYALLAPLIGLGAASLFRHPLVWANAFLLAILVVPIYADLPEVLQEPAIASRLPVSPPAQTIAYRDPYEFYLKPWKTGRNNERRYIEEVLAVLPERAVFLCNSTARDGIKAVQVVEGQHAELQLGATPRELADLLETSTDGRARWRQPVYTWAPLGSGVPSAIARHCRFIVREHVWEVLPPEDPQAFRKDLLGEGAATQHTGG